MRNIIPFVAAFLIYQFSTAQFAEKSKTSLLSYNNNADAMEMIRRVDYFYSKPEKFKVIETPRIPDGSPIGMDCMN